MNDIDHIKIEQLNSVDFHASSDGGNVVILQLSTNAGDHFIKLYASDLAHLGERFTANATLLLAGRDRAAEGLALQ